MSPEYLQNQDSEKITVADYYLGLLEFCDQQGWKIDPAEELLAQETMQKALAGRVDADYCERVINTFAYNRGLQIQRLENGKLDVVPYPSDFEQASREIFIQNGPLLDNPRGRFIALGLTLFGAGTVAVVASKLSKGARSSGSQEHAPKQGGTKPSDSEDTGSKEEAKTLPEDENQVILNVPYFDQKDERWAWITLGNNAKGSGYNIHDFGCLITSFAMLRKARGEDINPKTINEELTNSPGVFGANDGNYNQSHGDKAQNLDRTWTTDEFWGGISEKVLGRARKVLAEGKPLIAHCNLLDQATAKGYKEHYVLVIGYEKDPESGDYNYIFHDPWIGEARRMPEDKFAKKMISFRAYNVNINRVGTNETNQETEQADNLEENTAATGERIVWSENYEPKKLSLGQRPELAELDPATLAWYQWLKEGNLSYETLWYWHDCVVTGNKDHCSTKRYRQAMPPIEYVQAAFTVFKAGGAPAWDILTQKIFETGNSKGPFATSSAGAKGPFQIKDWTFNNFSAYQGNVQNPLDAAFAASNLLVHSNMIAHRTTKDVYARNYAGQPCNPPNEKKCQYGGKYNTFMWNDYEGMGDAAYLLSKQLMETWLQVQRNFYGS